MSDAGTAAAATATPGAVSAASAGAAPANGANGAASGTAQAWYAGLPEQDQGYLQTKGWVDSDPAKVAADVMRAYREYERWRGVPQEQIVTWPKDAADTQHWEVVHARLGVPKTPEEYKFDGLSYQFDNPEVEREALETFRQWGAELKLTPDQLKGVAERVLESYVSNREDDQKAQQAAVADSIHALEREWGPAGSPRYALNMATADKGAAHFNVTAEEFGKMANAVGHDRVAEMFRKIGAQMGEDRFVRGGPTGDVSLTRAEALSRQNELIRSPEFVKRYHSGDPEARRQLADLNRFLAETA